jgi:hypothetical protein
MSVFSLSRQEKLSATHTLSGVKFRPPFYNFEEEQRGKAAVWSEENEMLSVNLSIRSDDEAGV